MTGATWRTCRDPLPMLKHLIGKVPQAVFRHFACACCRRHWHTLDEHARAAVEAGERHADGLPTARPLWAVVRSAREADRVLRQAGDLPPRISLAAWSCADHEEDGVIAALYASRNAAEASADPEAERAAQCDLLRDVAGDPFAPVEAEAWWLTPDVVALADAARADPDANRLTALADALEQAGCADARVLGHLRGPGSHARGCWAVRLLRG